MGDISKNFSRWEYSCNCGCGFDTVDVELNHVMQKHVRDYYNKPVTVTGGNRCFPYNLTTPGASKTSEHVEAKANDFTVEGVSPRAVYIHLDSLFPKKFGIGLYEDRVHFDVGSTKRRWNNTDVPINTKRK